MQAEVQKWRGRNTIGNLGFDPDWYDLPGKEIKAREQFEEHVEKLAGSFDKHQTINPDVQAAIYNDDLYELLAARKKALKDSGGSALNTTRQSYLTMEEVQACNTHGQVFTGQHTVTAVRLKRDMQPEADLWKIVYGTVFVCRENNRYDQRMCLMLANASNEKNEEFLKRDFAQTMHQMHNRYYEMVRAHSKLGRGKEVDKRCKEEMMQLKRDMKFNLKCNDAQMGQWFQIAKQPQDLFQKLLRVMRCEFAFEPKTNLCKTNKPVTSSGHLTAWVSLPYAGKHFLLEEVINGNLDTGSMHKECTNIKARARIRRDMGALLDALGHLPKVEEDDYTAACGGWVDDREGQTDKWALLCRKFPWLEENIVKPWFTMVTNLKVSQPLPHAIKKSLLAGIKAQQEEKVSSRMFFCSPCILCQTTSHIFFRPSWRIRVRRKSRTLPRCPL
jgi:hypothetical protein